MAPPTAVLVAEPVDRGDQLADADAEPGALRRVAAHVERFRPHRWRPPPSATRDQVNAVRVRRHRLPRVRAPSEQVSDAVWPRPREVGHASTVPSAGAVAN